MLHRMTTITVAPQVYPTSTMQSDGHSGLGALEAQLASKEKEWKELLAARDHQLEASLTEAQQESFFLRYLLSPPPISTTGNGTSAVSWK